VSEGFTTFLTDAVVRPPCTRKHALAVLLQLRDAGHVAYFAGGCVRDELLGLTPKDYDVATDASPGRVRELFKNTQAVGAAFGVILVRHAGSVVEVATFRSDLSYVDGRRPIGVRFTSAEEDARRRDFTINGLFLDPITNDVIDYVGGRADLAARILRAIDEPRRRFDEDHLRLLRAVRFASRFDFEIEPHTAREIKAHARKLRRISPERIADELRGMLGAPGGRERAWALLWEYALVDEVMRFLPGAVAESVEFDAGRSPFLVLSPGLTIPFGLALAAGVMCFQLQSGRFSRDVRSLLARQNVSSINHAMRQALRISNDELDVLQGCLRGAEMLLDDAEPTLARKKRFLATATWNESLLLLRSLHATRLVSDRIVGLEPELRELSTTDFAPPPLLTGDDLTAEGLKPGPIFRRILERVYDAQLEGSITTREQAFRMARQE